MRNLANVGKTLRMKKLEDKALRMKIRRLRLIKIPCG